MQDVILYIEGIKVDLFKDENISLTSSIQDIRDISKIFTDFSKSFALPASKTNNKLFKHYYNSDIDGFDARTQKDANIELNHIPFREGKIKLNGVKLKNNKPFSYNVTFFGNTVSLKTVIGEDQLDQLSSLSSYDHEFNASTVLEGLTTNVHNGAIRYPLMTHTQRYTYDTNVASLNQGNIAYHTGASHVHGINFFDLKPGLSVLEIINAIEAKYTIANGYSQNIVFSNDFFSTSEEAFARLYLWLHRTKGKIGATTTGEEKLSVASGFSYLSGDDYITFIQGNSIWKEATDTSTFVDATITITPTQTGELYDLQIADEVSGAILLDNRGLTGTQSFTVSLPKTTSGTRPYEIKTKIITESALNEYDAKWRIETTNEQDPGEPTIFQDGTYQALNIQITSEVIILDNVPKIKIIDLLTGLFKMFNLTAYINGTEIKVEPLDNFYSNADSYDITKFVDVSSSDVNTSLPFREITFAYKEPKTFLADAFKNQNNKAFGILEYDGGGKLDGGKYEIKLPFEHMVFERLTDENDGVLSNSQYGYFVDKKEEPTIAAPLLYYNVNQVVGSKKMVYINGQGNAIIGSGETYITYNRPSNTNEIPSADYTLNFGSEFDEWDGILNNNSLFENFYKNYITDSFNSKNRLTKVTAFLPLKILLNYTLSDRFILNGKSYKINSINTDLQSGKSQIELLNDFT